MGNLPANRQMGSLCKKSGAKRVDNTWLAFIGGNSRVIVTYVMGKYDAE